MRGKLLVVGAGDIGRRVICELGNQVNISAMTSTPASRAGLRRIGARPVLADLDKPASLKRLPRDWDTLLHCAPPPAHGARDTRTRNILRAFARPRKTGHKRSSLTCCPSLSRGAQRQRTLVYLSTSGVYGDCGGTRISESQPLHPRNARAVRRVDAERVLIRQARRGAFRLVILRVPGIYSESRLPLARLRAGTPALAATDDVYTNHIHAADLATIAIAALRRLRRQVRPQVRIYNASDGGEIRMGDYFDLVADAFGLARPPRLPRAAIVQAVSPALLSFMNESRRLDNARLRRELPIRWFAPTVEAGVAAAKAAGPGPV
ncbi:MAG TPA: NAD-dependent epimerase/dehydratase family protein [Burkholderiales bacterium]|nr:NAD-dependent epimerase/dehydratase family protein [Burkholderiales bacterium]